MTPKSFIEDELYKEYDGLTLEGWVHRRTAAMRLDEDFIIRDATMEMARMVGFASERDMTGLSFIQVMSQASQEHQWLQWASKGQQLINWQEVLDTAREVGIAHKTLNVVTPDMMVYRQVMEIDWVPTSQTYFLRANLYDPYIGEKAGGRQGPICIKPSGAVMNNTGGDYAVDDLALVMKYLEAPSVAALAEAEGMTTKACEYKLRQIAEHYGYSSIGELVKHYAGKFCRTLPQPTNTVTSPVNHTLYSRWRFELIPNRFLPTVRGYMSKAVKRVIPQNTDAVDGLRAKLAKYKKDRG